MSPRARVGSPSRRTGVARGGALLLVLGLGLLSLAAPAAAHVTVNPREASKGGFAKLAFRVPNERDTAGTTKLEVFFPSDRPIAHVSVRPLQGWTVTVDTAKLADPIPAEGGESLTEAVSKITWQGGLIRPGEFDEFEVSGGPLPENVDELVFKAIQTYSSGEVVRWIDVATPGGEEPEHPAPVLRLVAAGDPAPATPVTTVAAPVPPGGEASGADPARDTDGLAQRRDVDSARRLALVGIALGAAGVSLALRRRR